MPDEQKRQHDGITQAEVRRLDAETARTEADREKLRAETARTEADREKLRAETARTEADQKKLRAEAEKLKADADKARAESNRIAAEAKNAGADKEWLQAKAAKLKSDAEKSQAESRRIAAEAKKIDAVKEKLKAEAEKLRADAAKLNAEVKLIKAETGKQDADAKKVDDIRQEQSDLVEEANERMEAHAEASPSIRNFVRDSLLDIMGGVDDAAVVGKTRELTEGLAGYLPNVTAIGAAASGEQRAERVEFDLAVTVATAAQKGSTKAGRGGLRIAIPFSFAFLSAGGSAQFEHSLTRSSSREHVNRIRFSVPIVYAVQNAPPDED